MVRNLFHQVKFELNQGDWVLGIIARRLYNTNTCTLHLLEVRSLPIKSLAFHVQVTRMQERVKIQAVKS